MSLPVRPTTGGRGGRGHAGAAAHGATPTATAVSGATALPGATDLSGAARDAWRAPARAVPSRAAAPGARGPAPGPAVQGPRTAAARGPTGPRRARAWTSPSPAPRKSRWTSRTNHVPRPRANHAPTTPAASPPRLPRRRNSPTRKTLGTTAGATRPDGQRTTEHDPPGGRARRRAGGLTGVRGVAGALDRVQRVHAAVLAARVHHARLRPPATPVISPPVASFQRSWPPAASSVYRQWSAEPKWTRPSATTGEPTTSPPAANRHLGVPVTASRVYSALPLPRWTCAVGDQHRLDRLRGPRWRCASGRGRRRRPARTPCRGSRRGRRRRRSPPGPARRRAAHRKTAGASKCQRTSGRGRCRWRAPGCPRAT